MIAITDAGDSIFAPAVGLTASFVVAEVIPGIAICAVIFADSAPGPRADIWSPAPPRRNEALKGRVESLLFLRGYAFGLENWLILQRGRL